MDLDRSCHIQIFDHRDRASGYLRGTFRHERNAQVSIDKCGYIFVAGHFVLIYLRDALRRQSLL